MRLAPALPHALLAAALAIAAVAAGCGGDDGGARTADDGRGSIVVVATTTMLGDLARAVGGDAADVRQLLQPNSDPHDYEPRPADVLAVADADVVLASGAGLDGWIEDVVEQAGGDATVVDVAATLPHERDADGHHDGTHDADGHDHDGGGADPHWWHDPTNVDIAVVTVRDALTRANPRAGTTYAAHAAAHTRRVRALDAGIRRCIAGIPPERRKLVTDHDALGAFADRYGLEIVGAVIPSRSTQAQPSAGDLAALVRVIRREGVRAVFPESGASRELADTLAREAGVTSAHRLYGDTLGPAGSDAATYLGMAAHNADAIVRGLTGGARRCAIAGI